ncbi:unnamed protein product [Adineta ricciae]|uniref:Uncharacterized protein n=1 Tax=Adineta ricciae TaxID=249248 RepID=A0A813ZC89_ADIRI|nr:unnamed protein product [Adineta ricciae]
MFRIRSDPRLSESNAIPSPGFHRIRRIPVGSDKILYWIRWGPSMGLFDLGISGSKIICPAIGGIHPRHISVAKLFGVKDGSRSSKSSSASSKASNDRAKPRPCLIWKTHPLVQVLVMARFGGMDVTDDGNDFMKHLPHDKSSLGSSLSCTGAIGWNENYSDKNFFIQKWINDAAPDANSIHRDIISSDDSENDILLNNESLLSSIFGTE